MKPLPQADSLSPTRAESAERSFEEQAHDLKRLERVVAGWADENQRGTVLAIRETLEALHKEALRRLIKAVKSREEGLAALLTALEDPHVAGVLAYHGLIRAPSPPAEPTLWERAEAALEEVRPALASHAGDVELIAIDPPLVTVRLLGSCDGCAFSDATVSGGIEEALKRALPEIERVRVQQGGAKRAASVSGSPFALPWEDVAPAAEVEAGAIQVAEAEAASLLLTRDAKGELRAYPNACPHLGMPLDGGEVEEGVLICPFHGFTFHLASGDCLSAPGVALPSYEVRERAGRVEVQVPR